MAKAMALCAALLAGAAAAQEAPAPQEKREEALAALDLPATAQSLREKGVKNEDVKETLRACKKKGLKAKERKALLDEADKAAKEHGPVDNFGAFVQSKLDSGLRGKELAAAIHAEHKARGKGKGPKKDASAGKGVKPDEKPSHGGDGGKGKGKSDEKGADKGAKEDKGKEQGKDKGKGKGQ
ncbi:MAG: hypothetical protein ACREID_03090 [Planctomycetota bacterium]